MTPEQEAAAEMRDRIIEAAFNEKVDGNAFDDGNVSDDDLTYNRAIDHVVAAVRAIPLPEAKPDPRDVALAKAREALKEIYVRAMPHGPHNMICDVAQRTLAAIESALNGGVP